MWGQKYSHHHQIQRVEGEDAEKIAGICAAFPPSYLTLLPSSKVELPIKTAIMKQMGERDVHFGSWAASNKYKAAK